MKNAGPLILIVLLLLWLRSRKASAGPPGDVPPEPITPPVITPPPPLTTQQVKDQINAQYNQTVAQGGGQAAIDAWAVWAFTLANDYWNAGRITHAQLVELNQYISAVLADAKPPPTPPAGATVRSLIQEILALQPFDGALLQKPAFPISSEVYWVPADTPIAVVWSLLQQGWVWRPGSPSQATLGYIWGTPPPEEWPDVPKLPPDDIVTYPPAVIPGPGLAYWMNMIRPGVTLELSWLAIGGRTVTFDRMLQLPPGAVPGAMGVGLTPQGDLLTWDGASLTPYRGPVIDGYPYSVNYQGVLDPFSTGVGPG